MVLFNAVKRTELNLYANCDKLEVNNCTEEFRTSSGKITQRNRLNKNTIIILPEELQLDNNFVIKCFNATPNNDPNNEPAGILISIFPFNWLIARIVYMIMGSNKNYHINKDILIWQRKERHYRR